MEKAGLKRLYETYSAVIFATGAEQSRSLNMLNEDCTRCVEGHKLFYWYNDQSKYTLPSVPENITKIGIIGYYLI